MANSFTKLFSSITESTVWCESHATRIVWITMLAMADRKGRVSASVPGLANRARVTLEECEHALSRFMEPDRYSRTPDNDGRRIEKIDGGWVLLNYAKYREMRDHDARVEYQREWDRTHRSKSPENPTDSDKSDQIRPLPTKAEAEESKEAAASAAPDPIWGHGLSLLTTAGIPEPHARSFLGTLLGTWEQRDVLGALQAASGKADPRAYVRGVLRGMPKKGEQVRKTVAM